MPELPDVEGFRRTLAEHAVRRQLRRVDVLDRTVLRGVTVADFVETLTGQRFRVPRRLGKWLVAPTGTHAVMFHFGMTGSLQWARDTDDRHPHDRVVFGLTGGELRYRDMRKLKGLWLVDHPGGVRDLLADTGPDAMQVSAHQLGDLLGGLRRQVKTALTDQSIIAGIGNLLADEILWRARIHPRARCVHLRPRDFTRLHAATGTVLRQSIKAGRVPGRKTWLTGSRDVPRGSCPRCGADLVHDRTNGRATTWCPRCQPRYSEQGEPRER